MTGDIVHLILFAAVYREKPYEYNVTARVGLYVPVYTCTYPKVLVCLTYGGFLGGGLVTLFATIVFSRGLQHGSNLVIGDVWPVFAAMALLTLVGCGLGGALHPYGGCR